jgi:ABC-2 type transport system ATP-binding protein
MQTQTVIEVNNLVKDFRGVRAVNDISFVVPKGKIVGFLGPNGAGKTTTINILMGITSATSGKIHYFGQDFIRHKQRILQRINYASAFNTLQNRITVWENLVVFALLYNAQNYEKRIMELVEYFEVKELLNTRYTDISSGQKTRVNLIKSLINDPEILLMDEPTASLDPDIADKTLSLITKLKKEKNMTILYTSHNMSEITRICDDVIFLDHGTIVAQDTPLGLTKRINTAVLRLTFNTHKSAVETYLRDIHQPHTFENDHTVLLSANEKIIPDIIFGISKTGSWVTDIDVQKPTLEDVFLHIARGPKQ